MATLPSSTSLLQLAASMDPKAPQALVQQTNIFEAVLQGITDGVAVSNLEGQFLYFNAAAEEILGIGLTGAPLDEWSTRYGCFLPDMVTLYPPRDLPVARAMRGAVVQDGEIFIRHAGRPHGLWLSVNASPLRDAAGNLVGAVGVFRDVTARKRLDEALRLTADELARSNQDLQQFAYIVSHDLQEPLRKIGRCCQMLEERCRGQLDSDANTLLERAIDGAARMEQMIQQLLAHARFDRRRPRPEPADLHAVFVSALEDLPGAAEAIITIEPLPTVPANATQMRQLALNLLSNALKYRKQGPPHVRVSAQRDGADWTIAVQDDGIGIAPEALARIFALFERAAPGTAYPGTGLGLAICKRIVESHGGRIWAESQAGAGTTVYFTLPAGERGLPGDSA